MQRIHPQMRPETAIKDVISQIWCFEFRIHLSTKDKKQTLYEKNTHVDELLPRILMSFTLQILWFFGSTSAFFIAMWDDPMNRDLSALDPPSSASSPVALIRQLRAHAAAQGSGPRATESRAPPSSSSKEREPSNSKLGGFFFGDVSDLR